MDINFEYYKIFYYVAKYQNLTKAAHALNSSQPNVTRAMNCLEQEVNCTLFTRTNRGVCLTPEGERLYARVSVAMRQLQLAEEELSESVGLEHGSISIGASEIALNIYLLDRLKKFHTQYPGVGLKIHNHSTPQAIRAVQIGEIDQVLPLVKSELGLAFLPEEMAKEALERQEVCHIPLKEKIPKRYVCMVYDTKRSMSVAAQRLKKILLEESEKNEE